MSFNEWLEDHCAAPQPAEQKPIKSSLALDAATHLTNWLEMELCECESVHTCGYNDVKRTRDALLVAVGQQPVEQQSAPNEQMMVEAQEWQPIETAPHGKAVLVFYKNRAGMGRSIKAEYIEKHTEEASEACINIDFFDYCEEKDEYFTPAGWYEIIDNGHEYSSYALETGNNPTHWMPLPKSPKEQ